MDGEAETVEEKVKKLESLLEEYEDGLHVNQFDIIEINFEQDLQKIGKMGLEDIHQCCLQWGYYAAGLQKQINKHKARCTWSEKNLKMVQAKEANKYNGFTYDERKDQVLADNSFARALYQLGERSQIVLDRLAFMVQRIDYLTKSVQDLIETKRKAQYFNRGS